jgi:hypothetical protein
MHRLHIIVPTCPATRFAAVVAANVVGHAALVAVLLLALGAIGTGWQLIFGGALMGFFTGFQVAGVAWAAAVERAGR